MNNQLSLPPRKCNCVDGAQLVPVSHKLQIYNSLIRYECDTCSTTVELQPVGSIGTILSVGALVIGFIWFINFSGAGSANTSDFIYLFVVIALLALVTVPPLWRHWVHPILAAKEDRIIDQDTNTSHHLLAKPIEWQEKFGFVFGLLAPIFAIALILGAATLIGFINFTYFGN